MYLMHKQHATNFLGIIGVVTFPHFIDHSFLNILNLLIYWPPLFLIYFLDTITTLFHNNCFCNPIASWYICANVLGLYHFVTALIIHFLTSGIAYSIDHLSFSYIFFDTVKTLVCNNCFCNAVISWYICANVQFCIINEKLKPWHYYFI